MRTDDKEKMIQEENRHLERKINQEGVICKNQNRRKRERIKKKMYVRMRTEGRE